MANASYAAANSGFSRIAACRLDRSEESQVGVTGVQTCALPIYIQCMSFVKDAVPRRIEHGQRVVRRSKFRIQPDRRLQAGFDGLILSGAVAAQRRGREIVMRQVTAWIKPGRFAIP